MTGRFQKISDGDLREIALAIRSGRLSPPYTTVALQRIVSGDVATLAADLQSLAQSGFGAEQVAVTLELMRADRLARPRVEDLLELVTTGPEASGITNRDTGIVVRELFANARESVLVVGYAVYQGRRVFQALADRMDRSARPEGPDVPRHPARTRGHDGCPRTDPSIRRPIPFTSMADRSTVARGLLRSEIAGNRPRAAGKPAREMRSRRWEGGVRLVGEFHGSGSNEEYRGSVLIRSPAIGRKLSQQFEILASTCVLKPVPLPLD